LDPVGPSSLSGLDLPRLPYPVALTAQRLHQDVAAGGDLVRTHTYLRDAFEAVLKYLGALLLVEYLPSATASQAQKEALLRKLIRPSAGDWVNDILDRLARLLHQAPADALAGRVVRLLLDLPTRGSPTPTELLRHCLDFVRYRNEFHGHAGTRSDADYREQLERWLPRLGKLLDAVAVLADWRLCLAGDIDRRQVWMGPTPPTTWEPATIRRSAVGHFVLCGPNGAVVDLFPFLCYTPADNDPERLRYYDSMYAYKARRKEAFVLAYEDGERRVRPEPVPGLEERFTAELLAQAFTWHRGKMEIIEGRVASFGELSHHHRHWPRSRAQRVADAGQPSLRAPAPAGVEDHHLRARLTAQRT